MYEWLNQQSGTFLDRRSGLVSSAMLKMTERPQKSTKADDCSFMKRKTLS